MCSSWNTLCILHYEEVLKTSMTKRYMVYFYSFFQLSYVRTYHIKLMKIKQDMSSVEDRVGRLQVSWTTVADLGEGPGGPLIFRPIWGPMGRRDQFPLLFQDLDDRPTPIWRSGSTTELYSHFCIKLTRPWLFKCWIALSSG